MARALKEKYQGKVYPGGQVWLGKWIIHEGYEGDVAVLNTPSMVILLKPGLPRHAIVEGMRSIVRELENNEMFDVLKGNGDIGRNGPEIDGLEFVSRRLTQLSTEVGVLRMGAVRRKEDGAKAKDEDE